MTTDLNNIKKISITISLVLLTIFIIYIFNKFLFTFGIIIAASIIIYFIWKNNNLDNKDDGKDENKDDNKDDNKDIKSDENSTIDNNDIIVLSDIHVDPLYDYTKPNGISTLWKSKISPEQGVLSRDFTNILNCGVYKPYITENNWPPKSMDKNSLSDFQLFKNNQFKRGADPPIMMLFSALRNIKKKYNKNHSLFFCGDSIAHNIDDNLNLSRDTFKYAMTMMANSVKRGRFFPAIGNNDGIHDNEFRNITDWNTMTTQLFKDLGIFDPNYGVASDIDFFTNTGYYIKGFDDNTIVISINTELFGKDATQPSSAKAMLMLNKMESDLKTYSAKNVYIIGHYPPFLTRLWSGGPAPFAWGGAFDENGPSCGTNPADKLPPCNQIFLNIIAKNTNNRKITLLFGHTHIDQVGIDKKTGIKWITAPSLTGSFSGVSPAYISINNKTKNIETNYLNIQNGDNILDAKWIHMKGLIMPPMKDPCLDNNCLLCDGYPQS